MEAATRIGVYGIVLDKHKILLTKKVKGPFIGLWDLPGGAVEFGENAEATLRREMREEVALDFSELWLFENVSHTAESPFRFHHLGQIYWVRGHKAIADAKPEDPFEWHLVKDLTEDLLTPFAGLVLKRLKPILREKKSN